MIVLVAVVLWLVYLLPSWHSRHQFTSAERNAVRLNQALRVLAQTSETPGEVRLELTARTALQQQKLARRAQLAQEQAEIDVAKARLEVERQEALAAREAVRAAQATAIETARTARAQAHAAPAARRARVRRRLRLTTTTVAALALGLAGFGGWQLALGGSALFLGLGGGVAAVCVLLLHRMSRVAGRAAVSDVAEPVVRRAAPVQDLSIAEPPRPAWTPRELPRPLVSSAGSRAAAVLDQAEARAALREAAREQALRDLARESAPPSIDTVRTARAAAPAPSAYAGMGYVDDAEIEDHVRQLLARRAVGA